MSAKRKPDFDMKGVLFGTPSVGPAVNAPEPQAEPPEDAVPPPTPLPTPPPTPERPSARASERPSPSPPEPSSPSPPEPSGPTADVQGRKARSGSIKKPYERRDGQQTVHVTFSIPLELAKKIRRYTAEHDPGMRNDWAAHWLSRGMEAPWQGGEG